MQPYTHILNERHAAYKSLFAYHNTLHGQESCSPTDLVYQYKYCIRIENRLLLQ